MKASGTTWSSDHIADSTICVAALKSWLLAVVLIRASTVQASVTPADGGWLLSAAPRRNTPSCSLVLR